MNRFSKKMKVAVGVVALTLVAAGAYAFWTGGGSGTGSGTAGTSATVTLTGTVAPGLAPATSRAVTLTAANADDAPIYVTTVHLVGVTVDGAHAGCVTSAFTMADVTVGVNVPAGATAAALTDGSLAMADTGINQDACQGATLTLALSST
jgi:hypothetical protein